MGVPVVALLGSSMISRQSAALVSAAGFPQWVAASDHQCLELIRSWWHRPTNWQRCVASCGVGSPAPY